MDGEENATLLSLAAGQSKKAVIVTQKKEVKKADKKTVKKVQKRKPGKGAKLQMGAKDMWTTGDDEPKAMDSSDETEAESESNSAASGKSAKPAAPKALAKKATPEDAAVPQPSPPAVVEEKPDVPAPVENDKSSSESNGAAVDVIKGNDEQKFHESEVKSKTEDITAEKPSQPQPATESP